MWRSEERGREELKPGETLGCYRLEAMLGEGGMGIVFRAVREPDGETVALKILKSQVAEDAVFRRRFVHEARAAREVHHKHLVPIVDAGEERGYHFLAVRFVAGRSLADEIETQGTLPLERLPRLVSHIASGLDALHAAGLVHRDVKPSNIMLDEEGAAVLTDFGLAKGPSYTTLTKPGQVMGTLDYLAPELIKGAPASPASDIYAFGCIVFECISGAPPFGDKVAFEVAMAHLEEEPPDPGRDRDDVPPSLSWAALKALAKDPAERPSTATAYAQGVRMAVELDSR